MTPIDLPSLFDTVADRRVAIGAVASGPERVAIDSLVDLFLIRGREALDRFTRHGHDAATDALLTTACAAGLAFKKLLLASRPSAEHELSPFLADMHVVMVELFERIHASSAPSMRH
jgi:hypothetical protein